MALALDKQYKIQDGSPYGLIPSKTFGAPIVSGNINSPLGKSIIKNSISDLGVASGLATGAFLDSAVGFYDGGLLTSLGAISVNI